MATAESRKRCSTPFLDEPVPLPPHLAKRSRCSTDAAALQQPFVYNPLDALRLIFPDVEPHELEKFFETSGRNLHAAISAYRDHQARAALSSEVVRAAQAARTDECAEVFVKQMAAASDTADAKNRASWLLELFKKSVAERASSDATTSLRGENANLKAQVEALIRANAVLKPAVAVQHKRQKDQDEDRAQLERVVSECKQHISELEMKNYALTVHLRDAENRSSSIAGNLHHNPDVF